MGNVTSNFGNNSNLNQKDLLLKQNTQNDELKFLHMLFIEGIQDKCKIYQKKENEFFFSIQVRKTDYNLSQSFNKEIKLQFSERIKLQHPNLISCIRVDTQSQPSKETNSTQNQAQVSSNNNSFNRDNKEDLESGNLLSLMYEYNTFSLETLISERLGSNRLFPEDDLINLAKSVLNILNFLSRQNIPHGDIHPSSIFFNQFGNNFAIYDRDFLCGRCIGMRLAESGKKFGYLSPEQLALIRSGSNLFSSNEMIYKSDIFCLGMTILEAASLRLSKECYGENYSILVSEINERLSFIQKFYSAKFYGYLCLMLEQDVKKRQNPQQLWNQIQKDDSFQFNSKLQSNHIANLSQNLNKSDIISNKKIQIFNQEYEKNSVEDQQFQADQLKKFQNIEIKNNQFSQSEQGDDNFKNNQSNQQSTYKDCVRLNQYKNQNKSFHILDSSQLQSYHDLSMGPQKNICVNIDKSQLFQQQIDLESNNPNQQINSQLSQQNIITNQQKCSQITQNMQKNYFSEQSPYLQNLNQNKDQQNKQIYIQNHKEVLKQQLSQSNLLQGQYIQMQQYQLPQQQPYQLLNLSQIQQQQQQCKQQTQIQQQQQYFYQNKNVQKHHPKQINSVQSLNCLDQSFSQLQPINQQLDYVQSVFNPPFSQQQQLDDTNQRQIIQMQSLQHQQTNLQPQQFKLMKENKLMNSPINQIQTRELKSSSTYHVSHEKQAYQDIKQELNSYQCNPYFQNFNSETKKLEQFDNLQEGNSPQVKQNRSKSLSINNVNFSIISSQQFNHDFQKQKFLRQQQNGIMKNIQILNDQNLIFQPNDDSKFILSLQNQSKLMTQQKSSENLTRNENVNLISQKKYEQISLEKSEQTGLFAQQQVQQISQNKVNVDQSKLNLYKNHHIQINQSESSFENKMIFRQHPYNQPSQFTLNLQTKETTNTEVFQTEQEQQFQNEFFDTQEQTDQINPQCLKNNQDCQELEQNIQKQLNKLNDQEQSQILQISNKQNKLTDFNEQYHLLYQSNKQFSPRCHNNSFDNYSFLNQKYDQYQTQRQHIQYHNSCNKNNFNKENSYDLIKSSILNPSQQDTDILNVDISKSQRKKQMNEYQKNNQCQIEQQRDILDKNKSLSKSSLENIFKLKPSLNKNLNFSYLSQDRYQIKQNNISLIVEQNNLKQSSQNQTIKINPVLQNQQQNSSIIITSSKIQDFKTKISSSFKPNEDLNERVKQVIARSQAIRKTFE